jgi:hypothetical protein
MKKMLVFAMMGLVALGFYSCGDDEDDGPTLKDVTLTYSVNLPQNNTYAAVAQKIDSTQICNAFGGITYAQFVDYLGDKIKYYAIKADGTKDETAPTANGNGHWFDANGAVCTWGSGNAMIYSEYVDDKFTFNIGQYPDKTSVGNTFTIRQGFEYSPDATSKALATIVFNITITAAGK